jgi:hypothetical protein
MRLSGRCRFDPTLLARFGIRFSFARAPHCSLSLADAASEFAVRQGMSTAIARIREAENPHRDYGGEENGVDVVWGRFEWT